MIEGRDISYGVKLYLSSKLVPAGLLWIGGMVGPYWLLDWIAEKAGVGSAYAGLLQVLEWVALWGAGLALGV